MFVAILFKMPQIGNNPNILQWVNVKTNCGTSAHWNVT